VITGLFKALVLARKKGGEMQRSLIVALAVLFIFAFFSEMTALDVWNLVGHEMLQPQDFSAATYSMGGLTTVGARGAEAVFSNPAGMALGVGDAIAVHLTNRTFIMGNPPHFDDDYYENIGVYDYSAKFNFKTNYLSNIGVNVPYVFPENEITIAGGVAWRRYYDFVGGYTGSYKDITDYEYETDGSLSSSLNLLEFSGAVAYQGKYAAGLTFGFPLLSAHNESSAYREPAIDYEEEYEEEAKLSGTLFRLGTIIHPVPMFAFGFSFTGGITMKADDIEWKWKDNLGNNLEGTSPDVELEAPGFISIGANIMPNDMVTLGFEYQTRPWDGYEADNTEYWEASGFSLRAGGELDMGSTAVRFGYIMDKGHFYDEDVEPVPVHTITGGLGFGTEKFGVDVGMGYTMGSWEFANNDQSYNLLQARFGFTYAFASPWAGK
jgi:hypothetical protein